MTTVPMARRPYSYVVAGLLLGVAYALLNAQTDDWAQTDLAQSAWARSFFAFHAFVDRGIPILAGGLVGLAFHWLYLRSRLAHAERLRSDELRSRLSHVERDQAVWLVAASTLHALKNPLHTLGLLVDELADVAASETPERIAAQVELVRAQMDRALSPLNALRPLARQGPHAHTVRPAGATAAETVASLRPLAAELGVDLRLDGDADATAPVNAELVRIILDNLLSNAFEGASPEARARTIVVRITDDPAGGRVVLRVSDDGPGLDDARREALFEPLQTVKSSGLGLGLPIARALARTLGGDLSVVETPGFSTSFELVVPVAAEAA
jgi:signal transduction histidine kinase